MISDDSGVKFFDRKFVAANLQSQLRCPKCDHEYSHRHTAGNGAENFRPFLLPCGHNLCEFCLSKHRQEMDFKCAVCNSSAPPTLNAKNPNSKYPSNIRDYYELDYHVLGEVNSLKYYQRYSVDAVNKSLHCNQMSDIVMDIKCCECGHSAAMGECKQCNAFYCKRCFDAVHHRKRVLETHVYVRLEDKKRPSKHFRVGKDIFRMPVPQHCNAHNMPANVYCQGCKTTGCLLCTTRYHPNHKTCPVGELNRRYLTEIPATLNVIDSALSDLDGAKLVVKNSKKKLGDFAAETLASISKHFRLLHGQLQNVELQTIEELRESSLSPQMQLNEAMSRLNGYETMLKNLRQMLCPSDDSIDDMQVPQDIWLKEVITLINENIEKIPSYVNVTKIDSNPYHFTSSRIDLAEILGCHFISKFIDPQIEVHFSNDFDHQSIISSQSNSVTGSGKKYKKQPGMRYKVKNSHKSREASSDFEGDDNEAHRFLNSFSAMDISSSSNNKVALVDESMQLTHGSWFKTDALVCVRAMQTPEDFYVQSVHAYQRIREHLEAFATTPACQPPGNIVVGQQYIMYDNQAIADRWHRSLVTEKTTVKPNTYIVFLPDIGLTYPVHCSNFRKLCPSIASFPYAAVHCSLKQLAPAKEGTGWEPKACVFLKQLVQNNPVHVTVIRPLGSRLYEVDLITKNYDSEISVCESFLYTGLARARHGHGSLIMSQMSQPRLMALQSQIIPKFKIYSGDVLIVQPLHVEHPHEFYVMPHDREKLRQSLQGDLQRVMNQMALSQLEHVYLGRLQLACVLQSEEQWHRARIEQILPEGYVQVRLVDSGISQKVFWDQLFVLPRQFFSEEIAIKCCLADVETLQKNGYTWSNSAISAFKLLISNPKLQMEVISVRDNVAHVALQFMRSSNESVNVAAMLVDQGLCLSCGENSKVQTPLVQRSQLDAETRKLIEQTMSPPSELEPAKLQEIKRSTIEVLHVEHPNEFYVTLSHFMIAIAELRRTVQETAEEMRKNCTPHNNWQSGDLCYVHVRAASEQDTLWHRGQVRSVIPDGETCKYNVHLRDIGELVKNVTYTKLTAMDEVLGPITNSAMLCHLYGITAKSSTGWPLEAINFFKSQLQGYSSLHVNGHGRNGDSLAVTLWGARVQISGPFTPAITKYVNINKKLVHFAWADLQLQQDDNSSVRSLDTENSAANTDWDHYLLEKTENASNNSVCLKIDLQHNDEMPPIELLNDFNIAKPTTGCTEAPAAWLKPRKCDKTLFTSLPTFVNYNCEIFLSLSSDEEYIHYMRDLLGKCFKKLLTNQEKISYVIGQPVVVSYHLDKQLYRGIVKSNMSAKGEYKVYYVDYGNVESVTPAEMLPYAPFPQLNALCWPVGIYGVTPKGDKYSLKTMDTVHKLVVMKLSTIRVVHPKGPNGLPLCQIKVIDVDIATMMVENDMALRVMQPEQPSREKLSTFTMFDELLDFAKINTQSVVSQNNTTVLPPPSKKKFIKDSREHLMCDEEDFDCREAALQQLKTSVNFEQDDGDSENADEEQSSDGFSDEFVIEEINESIANDDNDNSTPSLNPDQAISLPAQAISAMDQIKRRVQLRYKERLDSYNFSPMDTSTERSYHNALGSLKSQTLPPGVKQFLCIIDKVISATELQISPQLTEFAKQEISLAQETSALIRETAPLHPIVQDALCLARYTKDNQWYRAIVKELNQMAHQATVYYIDFHDTEIVDFSALKAMPKQLFMFPQRSFRVKLHAIKMNRKFGENTVRHSLQACLCKYPLVFARVHYPLDYYNNNNESDSEWDSSDDSMRNGFKLFEVEIYENNVKTELLYKPLIDSRMYLLKKS